MNNKSWILGVMFCVFSAYATTSVASETQQLQQQANALQAQLDHLQQQLAQARKGQYPAKTSITETKPEKPFHSTQLTVHASDTNPDAEAFYPTALVADQHVLTYIAGTPVVSSPYLGERPAFDGSDYIVNISSINRDIRLMQQRRALENTYQAMDYPVPTQPIIAISGKAEPIATFGRAYSGDTTGSLDLGSNEIDVTAILNDTVEAYAGIAYDSTHPAVNGQTVANSYLGLNTAFINIGNLDASPFYLTTGQLFVPFGRYASAMVSSPLTQRLARTRVRPLIVGYKSQESTGPFASAFAYNSDTTIGQSGVGGLNLGYIFNQNKVSGEIGASITSALNNASGLQLTGATRYTTFGGFASPTNGSEAVHKVAAAGAHANLNIDRYNLTAEWVGALSAFHEQDLSMNGVGAMPQALQLESGMTFMSFTKPASLAVGYQWSKDTLALGLPKQRFSGVFNISIWKDTVESLEYRRDIDFGSNQYANGASAPGLTANVNTLGTGRAADTLLAQIGVYF
jgi:hypothetical protein